MRLHRPSRRLQHAARQSALRDVTNAKPDWAEAWDALARVELALFSKPPESAIAAVEAGNKALNLKPNVASAQV
jgi:hypothetical protein